MTAYATYFSSPIQVGTAIDNLQAGVGDVVLSQNLAIGNALNSSSYIVLPKGTDLLGIDLTYTTGVTPAAGAVSIFVSQLDGSGQAAGPVVTLSTTTYNNSVVFNAALAGAYIIPAPWRLTFTTTTAITNNPAIVAEVRYCIRGA